MTLEELIQEPFYMHVGRRTITVWNHNGKVSVPLTRKAELQALNPMAEPHLEKVEKKQFILKYKFYNMKKTTKRL